MADSQVMLADARVPSACLVVSQVRMRQSSSKLPGVPNGRTLTRCDETLCWQAAERHLQRWDAVLRQPQYYPTAADQINGTFTQVQDWLLTRLG